MRCSTAVPSLCSARALVLVVLAALTVGAWPASGQVPRGRESRHLDARVDYNAGLASEASTSSQLQAVEALRATIPDLLVSFDEHSGATRSVLNPVGYLTDPNATTDPQDVALEFVTSNLELLGLEPTDLSELEVTDRVYSKVTGSTHVYFRQRHRGLAVYNGQLQVHVNRDGRVASVNNAFLPGLASAVNTAAPDVTATAAVARAAEHLGVTGREVPRSVDRKSGPEQVSRMIQPTLSREPIEARLMWLPIRRGEARLVWSFQVHTVDEEHVYDLTVDAVSGQIWTRADWVSADQYRVFALPVESPSHSDNPPPADGRQLVVDPADPTASPSGWHQAGSTGYTVMRGNNVHAYQDQDANDSPPGLEPSCGSSLDCSFPLDFTLAPSTYTDAAVANLFYWSNIVHDIQYQYGFDEAAGNFQVDNFGRGGVGGDDVRAEAQDGADLNNADFLTPPDGSRPRMQMYLWNLTSPNRDGDFDDGIVVHEYGHGISVRQVGGPSNVLCLINSQQPGEGWSDWLTLVYTARTWHAGTDRRGIGTYAVGQPIDGLGIRTQPYSTDSAFNDHTYESIQGMAIPHGVGEVWAQALWEVYWTLVEEHGFGADLYDPSAGAGNHRAMLYVNEGLKNTACSPTFTDARDGIIQAAVDNFGGEDVCRVWGAFAEFGLGVDAVSGGASSTSPTNGFEVPAECQCAPAPVADAGLDRAVCLGEPTTIGTPAQSGHTYSWLPGGETTAQITVSPPATTTYTLTATNVCGSADDSVTVFVDSGTVGYRLLEDFEAGAADWSASGLWHLANDSQCAFPWPGYSSAHNAFYYGQDGTCDYATGAANSGELTSPPISGITADSSLTFDYLREVESFPTTSVDQTRVDIVTTAGSTTVFALDSSDPSGGVWKSSGSISLAAFAGQTIQVRFHFNTIDTIANEFVGWFIDDVLVTGASSCGPNTAPIVTIAVPADGSTFLEGTSVGFSGTATDSEDGDLTGSLSWSSSLGGSIGSGGSFSTSTLSVGSHTITASVTDSGGLGGTDSISIVVNPEGGPPPGVIDWSLTPTEGYPSQDGAGTVLVQDGGATLFLEGNRWRRTTVADTFTITAATVLEFEFQSTSQGEVHGIGFDEDDQANPPRVFQLYGTQAWGIPTYRGLYATLGSWVTYQIPVGDFYTGSGFRLVLVNDKDAGAPDNTSRFRNVKILTGGNAAPTVTITDPPNGSTFLEGTSVSFSGAATDSEDGDLTGSLSWSSSLGGSIGSGGSFSTSTLSVGSHTITASVTDSGGLGGTDSISIVVNPEGGPPPGVIDWSLTPTEGYPSQDGAGTVLVQDGGATLFLEGNRWRRTTVADTFTITAATVLEFEFQSSSQGEVHGIGFDEDDQANPPRVFQLYGTQAWGIPTYRGLYATLGSWVTYQIPVGDFYTGSGFRLVLVNDKDAGAPDNTSRFRNVKILTGGNAAPTVTITDPPNGSTFLEGTSVGFSGAATDFEDGDLTGSLSWSSSLGGSIGSGGSFSTSTLSVGSHTITASVTDSGGLGGTDSISIVVNPEGGPPPGVIDWSLTPTEGYPSQDGAGTVLVQDGGATLFLEGNRWRRTTVADTFTITAATVLEFEFQSSSQGEVHGIGFDEDDQANPPRVFQLYGTQAWGIPTYRGLYTTLGSWVTYQIPVGDFYTGSGFRLVLVNDKDAGASDNTSRFRNVKVFEE